jgi:hypothetical protein
LSELCGVWQRYSLILPYLRPISLCCQVPAWIVPFSNLKSDMNLVQPV